ncbi:S41 family peptidase [Desulfotruncus alcoholivorax]|uniref:S41 family peptidase n=1 Tax=Desulfotruncus alcoholivorax TaxID=265477 RepID=UPI0004070B9E|nr:S41 family peptidase [Desulfotruncus alcoholivorax]
MYDYSSYGNRPNKITRRLTVLAVIFFVVIVAAGGVLASNFKHVGNLIKVISLVRSQYIEPVDTTSLVDGAIRGMVDSLHDPYSVYLDPGTYKQLQEQISGSFGGLGILVGVKDELLTVARVYEGSPAYKRGIKEGDRIVGINGKDVRGIDLETAIGLMRGPVGTKVKLRIVRAGFPAPLEKEITREEISVPTAEGKMIPGTRIGYMVISQFNEKTPSELAGVLSDLREQGMRGAIMDLRNNPGGELISATRVADNFVPKGPIVYIEYSSGNTEVKEADGNYLHLPLVVLVNENSASAAEILAGAIKDTKAGTLVGTKTFGKGIVQTVFPLNNGAGLKLTTARYLTPGKHNIHKKGISPDVVVEDLPDVPGDEQLEKAEELIKSKIK